MFKKRRERKQREAELPYHRSWLEKLLSLPFKFVGWVFMSALNAILGIFGTHVALTSHPKPDGYLQDGKNYNEKTGITTYQHTFGGGKKKHKKAHDLKVLQNKKSGSANTGMDNALSDYNKTHDQMNGF